MSVPFADVFVLCYEPNRHHLARCVQKLVECTEVPFVLTVMLDGYLEEDVAEAKQLLHDAEHPSKPVKHPSLLRSHVLSFPQPVFVKRLIGVALMNLSPEAKLVAFLQPNMHLLDDRWIGKVQAPIEADGLAAASFFGYSAHDVSVDPVRFEKMPPASDAFGVALRKSFVDYAREHLQHDEWIDLHSKLASLAWAAGCSTWSVGSVRCDTFTAVPHVRQHLKKVGSPPRAHTGRDR